MAEEKSEFRAIHRYAPMSARKARPVAALVRGLRVNAAMEELEYVHRRAAPMVLKVLRSAVANAGQVGGVEAGQLYVKAAAVNEGPLKQGRLRWRPAPMGRAQPIRKRTCHIEVVVGVLAAPQKSRKQKSEASAEQPAGTSEPAEVASDRPQGGDENEGKE